ncbi:NAD-dependent epimerase/dehydratase family protein [Emticicia sp. BO119]|uniref:NAD-dependent epimerase/dehydratase family protein n=1 Tax=Emticicia sp. BO119 TaxID=2757768 RepID=UPI0015EFFD9C|nr:NAD-dependent epimerase/dehydratase family protein [Emticicia sp. BO119]MBA4850517.1 NAD(P)H-binding protein [Emticicia sp. BO119]
MKVLVLGGTGAMGMHLIQLLSRNFVETVVTSRTKRSSTSNINYIQGNAHDLDFIKTVLNEKWDCIIDFMVYTTSSFEERVHLFLEASSQYVFLSSARVYADSNLPIVETSARLLDISQDKEFLATDEYALSKARQEDILKNSGYNNWTIVRPYITYSENRLQLGALEKEEWLYRALKGRTIVFSSDINTKKTTVTYGFDVSQGILSIINNTKALGEIYHITAKDSHTWDEILTIYLDGLEAYLGYRPKFVLQDLKKFLKWKPAKYQVLYDRFFSRVFNTSKINQFVNNDTFAKVEVGLKNCLIEFLKDPKFENINWESEALKDKHVKEHTPLNEIQGIRQKMKYLIIRYF